MEQIHFDQVSAIQLYAYNAVCIIGFMWLWYKNRSNWLNVLVIILFFTGILDDLAGSTGRNIYRIGLLGFCTWSILGGALNKFYRQYPKLLVALSVYCLYYIVDSIFINHDNPLLTFSLLSKLLIPFMVLMLMLEQQEDDADTANDLFWLFGDILVIQILISICKFFIIGGFLEGWVGAMTGIRGGGAGTSFPLLGLMWLAMKNDMNFSHRDWFIAIGLLILGFAAGKRAVWILFPVLFVILSILVYRQKIAVKLVYLVALAPILFYLAIRISPTFNPENKVWGSFDPDYAVNYVMKYSTGMDDSHNEVQTGEGRVGAVVWMLEQVNKGTSKTLFGYGNEYFTYFEGENYSNKSYWGGIHSKGSITGAVQYFFTLGFVGLTIFLVFISMTLLTNKNRYNICLYVVVLFDFIFYNGQTINMFSLLTFTLFLSFFSPYLLKKETDDDVVLLENS